MSGLVALLFAVSGAGCQRQAEGPVVVTSPQVAPAPKPGGTPLPASPGAPAPSDSPASASTLPMTVPGAGESFPQSVNSALTGAVARFHDKHRRFPRDWNELVGEGFVAAMPKPSVGKRFAIDPDTRIVVEVAK